MPASLEPHVYFLSSGTVWSVKDFSQLLSGSAWISDYASNKKDLSKVNLLQNKITLAKYLKRGRIL